MAVLLISYGIREYDGRLNELYKVCKSIGGTRIVSCGLNCTDIQDAVIVNVSNKKYLSISVYLEFIYKCLVTAFRDRYKTKVLVVDNLYASIPGLIILKLFRPKYIIQDVRELYFVQSSRSLSEKIFIYFESKLMKLANIVICANEQRAHIMRERHNLKSMPIIFENMRVLNGQYDKETLDRKYAGLFTNKYNIVSTGGLSVLRGTDRLVEAMKMLPDIFSLFIVGDGSPADKTIIENIVAQNGLHKKVKLLGRIPMDELRYIVQQCQIGIVNYHQHDLNNQYCASGKMYEYLAEGLPIVTTENIPLVDFCSKTQVGVADNNFYNGIMKIANNYSWYKSNVSQFLNHFSVESNNEKLVATILTYLSA
jgi:glycosyltransferase involved in cell wall biosynthesis